MINNMCNIQRHPEQIRLPLTYIVVIDNPIADFFVIVHRAEYNAINS